MKEGLTAIGGGVVLMVYLGMGLVQFAALFAGFEEAFAMGWLKATATALIVSYTPLFGMVGGIWGAAEAWQWPMGGAFLLFAGPYGMSFLYALVRAQSA